MKLDYIEFPYFVRKDGVHRQGVGLSLDKEADRCCLGINNTMLVACITTKKCRVSAIVVYGPTEPTDGDDSGSDGI